MMPVFAQPAGLWVLLGIPALLAIHFLQQRARVVRTSTWFLIEKLAPDSARGRTWDRLRVSPTLWLQLLAIVLAAWILGEPRWLRTESAQTVVLVFDASASMEAFRADAAAAAAREMAAVEGLAARTTWVVLTSNPRQPPLYRGTDRAAAAAAIARWQPELGSHDAGPALRLARTLAGVTGRTLFITDARHKAPSDQRTVGVGQPIDNVGFAGAGVSRETAGLTWRAWVKNHAATAQRRTWHLEAGPAKTNAESFEIAPGALTEISGRWPEGAERVVVHLSDDGFAADNRLPLVAPKPKALRIGIEGTDETAEFLRKVARAVDGVGVGLATTPDTLRAANLSAAEVAAEKRGGIFWPPADKRAQAPLLGDPVTAEPHPLVAGLNWQGWIGTGPHGFTAAPGDVTLLWHGQWPLVLLRSGEAGTHRKLLLAFDWGTSNASRLPSTVLFVRRFLEAERDAQRAAYSANFDCGARVALAGVPLDGVFTLQFEPAGGGQAETRAIAPAERSDLRAPSRAGFFTLQRGDEVLVQGATQFADARQGDFRSAERFTIEVKREQEAAFERNTAPDPYVPLWLGLLVAVVMASWWTSRGRSTPAGPGEPARPMPASSP